MSRLQNVVKGKLNAPVRLVLSGVEGVGKTTFAAGAPSPIFLGAEDGTAQLDVHRLPRPEGWPDIIDSVRTLYTEPHDYKTLVFDTLDWAEPMLWDFITKRDKEKNIESYGYGKGYTAALDEWRIFVAELERLSRKGMHIILLAHAWIKTFKNPEGPDFDRYEMKLNAKAAGLLKEWSDAHLFANFETTPMKEKGKTTHKGVSTGARLMHTERRAAYDAKNRYGLPETMPLSWAEFDSARKQQVSPVVMREEILRKAKLLGGDVEAAVPTSLTKAGDNGGMLALLNNSLNAKLIERGITQ